MTRRRARLRKQRTALARASAILAELGDADAAAQCDAAIERLTVELYGHHPRIDPNYPL